MYVDAAARVKEGKATAETGRQFRRPASEKGLSIASGNNASHVTAVTVSVLYLRSEVCTWPVMLST
jgi:hypothetical protein